MERDDLQRKLKEKDVYVKHLSDKLAQSESIIDKVPKVYLYVHIHVHHVRTCVLFVYLHAYVHMYIYVYITTYE